MKVEREIGSLKEKLLIYNLSNKAILKLKKNVRKFRKQKIEELESSD